MRKFIFIVIALSLTVSGTTMAIRIGWSNMRADRQRRAIHALEESISGHSKRFRKFMARSSYVCYENPDSTLIKEEFLEDLWIHIECHDKLVNGRLRIAYDVDFERIKWEGHFTEGRLSGEWKSYDREGRLRGQGSQNGKIGVTTYYYPDGSVRAVYNTKEFEMHGSGNDYFPSGQIKYDVMWDTGKIQRLIKYAEDGTVIDRYPPG